MNKTINIILRNAGVYDKTWMKFLKTWIFVSLLVLLLTAFFAEGIYHFDEYFQTIEFANYKLGNTDKTQLAWEFNARMRPWLQPFCYYVLIKAFTFFGVTDPFTLVTIFRFVSAVLAWIMIMISIMMFSAYQLYKSDSQRKALVYILALLSFLPFMFVRTSSESLSSSFSMAGFGLLMLGSAPLPADNSGYKRNYSMGLLFAVGILWGIAFEFRYQCALLIAGFMFWLVFISIHPKKRAFLSIGMIILGIMLSVVLCTFLDSWGYGGFTVAPWNYLYQNIVLGTASGFGESPFYGYIVFMLRNPRRLPFFIILTAGTLLGIARNPKHPLSWGCVVFFVIHSMIAHKELRFLMNMLIPAIFLTVYGFYSKNNGGILGRIWNFRLSFPAKLFYAFNVLMFFICFAPFFRDGADEQFDKYLYHKLSVPCTVYAVNKSPFAPFGEGRIEYNFYKPKGLDIVYVKSIDENIVNMGGGGGHFGYSQ